VFAFTEPWRRDWAFWLALGVCTASAVGSYASGVPGGWFPLVSSSLMGFWIVGAAVGFSRRRHRNGHGEREGTETGGDSSVQQ
jgi:hypothetical protein